MISLRHLSKRRKIVGLLALLALSALAQFVTATVRRLRANVEVERLVAAAALGGTLKLDPPVRWADDAIRSFGVMEVHGGVGLGQPKLPLWNRLGRLRGVNVAGLGDASPLIRALGEHPHLEELSLAEFDGLEDSDLALLPACEALKSLDLLGYDVVLKRPMSRITERGVRHLAELPKLEHLSISDAPNVGDAAARRLARMPALVSLHFRRCAITNASLEPLADLPRLRSLSLLETQVTDDGLRRLAESGVVLQHLAISGDGFTDAGIPFLLRLNPQTLDLRGTALTQEGVDGLRRELPKAFVRSDFD